MGPEELGAYVAAGLGGEGVSADVAYGELTVDVPVQRWVEAATFVRDDDAVGADWFDWLSAYDDLDAGFAVVLHVWSVRHRHRLLLRTRVPREQPVLPTLVPVYAGAEWHERETFEMFGVVFEGHPNLVPLLLPDGFEGHPLRKEFVLASRVAKPWPGAKEPGESDHEPAGGRRRIQPPGVPEPGTWGPQRPAVAAESAEGAAAEGAAPEDDERAARRARAMARRAEIAARRAQQEQAGQQGEPEGEQ